MTGQKPPVPLTPFWRLMITFAALAGLGTCAVLGLVYVRFVMGVPGTVHVLERQLTKQDAVPAIQDEAGEAKIRESRFLAAYESMNYYAAPGPLPEVVCLVAKYPYDDQYNYWEACNSLGDGRDILVEVQDPDDRTVVFVPDQFDHLPLERDGWVTLHRNLLIQPLDGAERPTQPLTHVAGY
ncbi:hypothetical protein SAMN04489743_3842 [Pseudarthrobacter equi]|uniref:Uncharacterized protein n=2 Tax=Pseudarthrobacter equi TaxID=728066 RepID=A0A1H2BPA6_9MICC|nr:hypothetical protein SAMN04489743_3842 [Pseudarthrobacter equi]